MTSRLSYRVPASGEAAWIAAAPCALATIAAMVLLAAPIGNGPLGSDGTVSFLPGMQVAPEPVEHARIAIAMCGAFALPAIVFATRERLPALRRTVVRALVVAVQLSMVGLLALAVMAQEHLLSFDEPEGNRIFAPRTLVAAALLPLLALAALRRRAFADAAARVLRRESRAIAIACALAAAALTALWLSTAINSDTTIANQYGSNLIPWSMDDAFAVLDGRTPFVDFHPLYAHLWPYAVAAVMALAGSSSMALWTTTMATISGLAMLAVYAVLRRVVASPLLALALYVPFLATTFFVTREPLDHRASPAGTFSAWPLRYAGPYLLAWLTARHLDGSTPRRAWLLFTGAGIVMLNNAELGIPAFAATLAALLLGRARRGAREAAALMAEALAGALIAGGLVALLTIARTGRLPDLALLLEFPRIYGVGGWVLQPMPVLGLHVAIYVTLVAALTTAAVRATRGDGDAVLTGMLAWTGVFGLLSGGVYAGRSERLQLTLMLSAWCLALALLLVLVARDLAARAWRRPTIPELAVLFGFGLAVCSVAQIPTPWSQAARLREHAPEPGFAKQAAFDYVARTTRPGDTVMLMMPLGHRIAYALHLRNVAPYPSAEAMPTRAQVDDAVALARRMHVHRVFAGIYDDTAGYTVVGILEAFIRAGYELRGEAAPPLAYLLSDEAIR